MTTVNCCWNCANCIKEFIRARAAALSTFQNIPLEEAKQIVKADLKIEKEEGENQ